MNKLNGGYVMLDLDNTTGVFKRTEDAYNSGKPVMIFKDDLPTYVKIEKVDSASYRVYLPNGIYYNIASYGVVATYNLTPRYEHHITLAGTIGGVSKKLGFTLTNMTKDAYTSAQLILSNLKNDGYSSTDTPLLVADTSAISALIYATSAGSNFTLHTKAIGDNAYSDNAQNTLTVTDTVKTLW